MTEYQLHILVRPHSGTNQLRHPDDQATIGLLLCKSKNRLVAEYALRGVNSPMGIADWQTRLTESLPDELKSSLPSIEEIEAELSEGKAE